MPRAKRKAKWNWSPKGNPLRIGEPAKIYSDATLQTICQDHVIDGEASEKLRHTLGHQARIYLDFKQDLRTAPRMGNAKIALEELRDQASDLETKLRGIDDLTWNYFWKAEHQLIETGIHQGDQRMEAIGALTRQPPEMPGALSSWYTRDNIAIALKFLALIANTTLADLPKDKGGKPTNWGLMFWVGAMADFWERDLGRRFTVDHLKGEALSPALQFLQDCMKPLDAAAAKSVAKTAMLVRTELNLGRKRNR